MLNQLPTQTPYDGYQEIQVVKTGDVGQMTSRGWHLICFINDSAVESVYYEVYNPGDTQCSSCKSYHTESHQLQTSAVVQRVWAVLGKTMDETIQGLQSTISDLQTLMGDGKRELSDVLKQVDDLKRADRHSSDEIRCHLEAITRQNKELERLRSMEGDLSKARTFIGDKAWKKEILGEDS